VLAHIHPSRRWFACGTRPFLLGVFSRHGVRERPRTAKCPGPLRTQGALPRASRCSHRVGGRYPTVFATTGPCARPHPSRRLRPQVSVGGSSQVAASPCWEVALPDVISAGPSPDARPHAAAGRRGAHARYFPRRHRPSLRNDRSAFPRESAQRLQSGTPISQLQAFRYVLASRFACHPGRSYRCGNAAGQPWRFHPSRTCVVTFARIGYACRPNRAIDGWGLSPHKTRSLVGCSHPERSVREVEGSLFSEVR
jgi:hypothetical protein